VPAGFEYSIVSGFEGVLEVDGRITDGGVIEGTLGDEGTDDGEVVGLEGADGVLGVMLGITGSSGSDGEVGTIGGMGEAEGTVGEVEGTIGSVAGVIGVVFGSSALARKTGDDGGIMLSGCGRVTPLLDLDEPGVTSTVGGGSPGLNPSGLVEGIIGKLAGVLGSVAGITGGAGV